MDRILVYVAIIVSSLCCCLDVARADHIVLHSDATSLWQGQLIVEHTPLVLQDGERVVLLSEYGDLLEILGPFEGLPKGVEIDDFNMKDALSNLIDAPSQLHATLGSTRFAGILSQQDDSMPVWNLDPFSSGTQCISEREDVLFWRAAAEESLLLALQRPGSDGSGDVNWMEDQATARWPKEIPLIHGELYVLRRPGWMENAMIRIAVLPKSVVENPNATIAWLAINGCKRQAQAVNSSLL